MADTLVEQNFPIFDSTMVWEGLQVLAGRTAWAAPPGSPANHTFWHNFLLTPDGRALRVIVREDSNDTAILDFWFFHYWGHTGTSRVWWPRNEIPGPITIGTTPFFQWGEGRPLRVGNWFATGHAMVDRIRLTIAEGGEWSTGKVSNSTNTAKLLPFYNHPDAPSWITATAAGKAKTLWNDIFVAKTGRTSAAKAYTGVDREQFKDHPWMYAQAHQSGTQHRFGINLLGVDVWAGGDAKEEMWWMLLRKVMNQLGNWCEPDGSVVDYTASNRNLLFMEQSGFHPQSKGWNRDPSKGQNWFNHHPDATTPWTNEYQWMSRDPVTQDRWYTFNHQHWGINPVCQYYDRHKDPGVYQMILHLQSRWIASNAIVDKGPTYNAGAHRGRGRAMMSAVSMYMITQDPNLLTILKGRLSIDIGTYLSEIANNPSSYPYPPGDNQPWESGIGASGLIFALQIKDKLGSLAGAVEDMALRVSRWVLVCWYEYEPDKWGMPYQVNPDGTPKTGQSTNAAQWVWCMCCTMWLKYHKYEDLTGDEKTKLDKVFAYRFTNYPTGEDYVWPADWHDFYAPPEHTGTFSGNIPIPTMFGLGNVGSSEPTNPVGIFRGNIPMPTMSATGSTTQVTGIARMTIPMPIMVGYSAVDPVSLPGATGSSHITLPLPTMSATGDVHVTGLFDSTLPLPTMSSSGTNTSGFLARFSYTGDGTTKNFAIPFLYLHVDHLTVTVDGVVQAIDGKYLSLDTNGLGVTFATAPASATTIVIRRYTAHTLFVGYADGSPVLSGELVKSLRQCLFYSEETDDLV